MPDGQMSGNEEASGANCVKQKGGRGRRRGIQIGRSSSLYPCERGSHGHVTMLGALNQAYVIKHSWDTF